MLRVSLALAGIGLSMYFVAAALGNTPLMVASICVNVASITATVIGLSRE